VRTVAFVNRRAISAGALIALACERIVVADGATIGAATPVQMGEPGGAAQPVAEKTVSYMRKEFRATAESRGRPPEIAEAMVDADVEIPGLVARGKLLTLTTEEALRHRVADARAATLEAALAAAGVPGARVVAASPTWAEQVVRFLTHPVVSSLLMTLGILGVIIEVRTPGFGAPGLVGLACLGLFFWGHWLVRLAGWEELLLIAAGLALLALEALVLPGFGVAGVLGVLGVLAGLALSAVGAGATWEALVVAVGRVALSLVLAIAASLALMRWLPRLPFGRRLILATELPASAGYASAPEADRRRIGQTGVAVSPLHPAGIAELEGERVDVVSEGDYVEAGQRVVVTRVDGNRIVVRRRREAAAESDS
jgi:membrane-bound serine protease (ClpP class)